MAHIKSGIWCEDVSSMCTDQINWWKVDWFKLQWIFHSTSSTNSIIALKYFPMLG